jgi:hypothetical protein
MFRNLWPLAKFVLRYPITLAAWQLLTGILIAFLSLVAVRCDRREPQPYEWKKTEWKPDSSAYYKSLLTQERINQAHENQFRLYAQELFRLQQQQQATNRHLDSLAGAALQREIDRVFNRQPTPGQHAPHRDYPDRSGRTGRTPAPGRSALFGQRAEAGQRADWGTAADDPAVEYRLLEQPGYGSATVRTIGRVRKGFPRNPAEAPLQQARELGLAWDGRRRVLSADTFIDSLDYD